VEGSDIRMSERAYNEEEAFTVEQA
jgi:hypothetical protein